MSGLPWFRMYVDFLNDPKMIAIAFEDQRHFIGLLALKSDGVLDQDCDEKIMDRIVAQRLWLDYSSITDVKKRLVDAQLIDDLWQPIAWEKRQFRSDHDPSGAERQLRFRAKKKAKIDSNALRNADSNATVTLPDKTRRDKNREEIKDLSGKPDYKSKRETIIARLNQKTGARFQPHCAKSKKHIDARLNEGHRVEDFIAVIDARFARWWGDPGMQEFLRPETLFGSKFGGYLGTAHIPAPAVKQSGFSILSDITQDTHNESNRRQPAIADQPHMGQRAISAGTGSNRATEKALVENVKWN